MNILLIGGTRFLGRHIVDALLLRRHAVTLFNRGITDASPRPGVTQIHGDRNRDLGKLGDAEWDAVIDTSCYDTATAQISTRFFDDRTRRYLSVSTISVYNLAAAGIITEDTPVLLEPRGEYGPEKARCEAIVRSTFRHRATIVRPGLIVGPYDNTDRFTYWPVRVAAGGQVAAPVSPEEPVQFIDARDVAGFTVRLLELNDGGTYNVTAPRGHFNIGEVLDTCANVSGSEAQFRWLDETYLLERGVAPWMDLPLWVNAHSEVRSIVNADVRRAVARGLRIRPLAQTARDTLRWARDAGKRWGELRSGLTPEREALLLAG